MDQLTSLLNDVEKNVSDYYAEAKDGGDIHLLLSFSDFFSVTAYRIAEMLSVHKHDYNYYYFKRKTTVGLREQELINKEGLSAAKATIEAATDGFGFLEKELENQALTYRLEVVLKQLNVLITTIRQRISFLKKEYNETQRQV